MYTHVKSPYIRFREVNKACVLPMKKQVDLASRFDFSDSTFKTVLSINLLFSIFSLLLVSVDLEGRVFLLFARSNTHMYMYFDIANKSILYTY